MESIFSLKSRIGVLKRIPKSARPLAAKTYTDLINKCIANKDLLSWENLLTFSYKAFHISSEHKSKKKSLASIVKENLSNMTLPKNRKNKYEAADFFKRVGSKVADFDVKGAVKLLCSEDTFAPYNEDTIIKLKGKHPSPSRILNFPDNPTEEESFQTTPVRVKDSIMSFSFGTASGMDGFRPQFFKDLISTSSSALQL